MKIFIRNTVPVVGPRMINVFPWCKITGLLVEGEEDYCNKYGSGIQEDSNESSSISDVYGDSDNESDESSHSGGQGAVTMQTTTERNWMIGSG